jgi:hypothetical protein
VNRDLLENLGWRVVATEHVEKSSTTGFDHFRLAGSSNLDARMLGTSVQAVSGGVLYVFGGYRLETAARSLDLTDFLLRLRTDGSQAFELVTSSGESPFLVDRVMLDAGADGSGIQVRASDVRQVGDRHARIRPPSMR